MSRGVRRFFHNPVFISMTPLTRKPYYDIIGGVSSEQYRRLYWEKITMSKIICNNPTMVSQAIANYACSMENAIRELNGAAYWLERAAEKGMPNSLDGTDFEHEWCANGAKKVRNLIKDANLVYFKRTGVSLA